MIRTSTKILSLIGCMAIFIQFLDLNPLNPNRKLRNLSKASVSITKNKEQWKKILLERLNRVQSMCGDLCNVNSLEEFDKKAVFSSGQKFPQLTAEIDCDNIIESIDLDMQDLSFPEEIPEELLPFYTLNGAIPVTKFNRFFKELDQKEVGKERIWTAKEMERMIKEVPSEKFKGTYSTKATTDVKNMLAQMDFQGKSILIIGSEEPWVEAICLHLGASKVTRLDFQTVLSNHPKVFTLTPNELRKRSRDGNLEHFDGVVSISAIEHIGLGRYGEALNPWGDIIAVGRAWCVTKPKGFMILGVPSGSDQVFFNAHRKYGTLRWPLMTTNWRIDKSLELNKNYPIEDGALVLHSFEKLTLSVPVSVPKATQPKPTHRIRHDSAMKSHAKVKRVNSPNVHSEVKQVTPSTLQSLTFPRTYATDKKQEKLLQGLKDFLPVAAIDRAPENKWKKTLYERLNRVRQRCGDLCSVNSLDDFKKKALRSPETNFPIFTADVECSNLMSSNDINAKDFSFPEEIPQELLPLYSMKGAIVVSKSSTYLKDKRLEREEKSLIWKGEDIERAISGVPEDNFSGMHLAPMSKLMLSQIDFKGKSILVIGKGGPWVEAMCLFLGAAKVTRLDNQKITSTHPQVDALTPVEMSKRYEEGKIDQFDGVVSISTLAHVGLGRYGDALNPWSDIISIGKGWCVTKPQGFLVLGAPGGQDELQFNARRRYGEYRWPLLTANWVPDTSLDSNQKYPHQEGDVVIYSFNKLDSEMIVKSEDKIDEKPLVEESRWLHL